MINTLRWHCPQEDTPMCQVTWVFPNPMSHAQIHRSENHLKYLDHKTNNGTPEVDGFQGSDEVIFKARLTWLA